MFIFKLAKTDSDRRSAIISYRRVRQVRAGNQTDECQSSLKRNQVAKDTRQKIAVIIPLIIFQFSNSTVLVSFLILDPEYL